MRRLLVCLILSFGCEAEPPAIDVIPDLPADPVADLLRGDGWTLTSTADKKWVGANSTHSIEVSVDATVDLKTLSGRATAKRGDETLLVAVESVHPTQFDPIESLRVAKLLTDDPMSLQLHQTKPKDQTAAVEAIYKEAKAKLQLPDIPLAAGGKKIELAWADKGVRTYAIASQTLNLPFIPVTDELLGKRTETRAKIVVTSDKENVTFELKEVQLKSSNDETYRELPQNKVVEHPRRYRLKKIGIGIVEAFPLVDQPIQVGETVKYKTEMPFSLQGETGPIRGEIKFTVTGLETCKKSKSTCAVFRYEFVLDDMSDHPSSIKKSSMRGHGVYAFDLNKQQFESGRDVLFSHLKVEPKPMLDAPDSYMLMQNAYELE